MVAPRRRRVERRGGDPPAAALRPDGTGGRGGFSLVEVMVAILLTAIIVTSVFAVALTAQRGSAVFDRKLITNYAATQLLGQLKNYVTANTGGAGLDRGPNGPGAASWTHPNDDCGVCGANCYALDIACTHNVTTMLPAVLRAAPYGMTMTYTVTEYGNPGVDCTSPACQRRVNVSVNWGEVQ